MALFRIFLGAICCSVWLTDLQAAGPERWARLPEQDGAVEIPAQEWPLRPGPRICL